MKKISDKKQINIWLDKAKIMNCFSTENLDFYMYKYEKGEHITYPDKKLEEILFIVEGSVRIYGLRSNGTLSPVNQQNAPTIIGDMEFSGQDTPPFFTEAITGVTCISLNFKKYKNQLDKDIKFLHTILNSYADKLQIFAFIDTPAETIEEKVILYLENFCPYNEMNGIETAISQLRCSRRQLQRVLKKLCTDKKIEKIGKGKYRLIKK